MKKIVANGLPGYCAECWPKAIPWLFYGTGWQKCDMVRIDPHQVDYWYSRHSAYTASADSGFTVNSIYFFPPDVSPSQLGSQMCSAIQLALYS